MFQINVLLKIQHITDFNGDYAIYSKVVFTILVDTALRSKH